MAASSAKPTSTPQLEHVNWSSDMSLEQCNSYMLDNQVATDVNFRFPSPTEATCPTSTTNTTTSSSSSSSRRKTRPAVIVSAHRYMLMARSEVFRVMFLSDFAESLRVSAGRELVINIPDMDADTFRQMLRFIYTEKAEITPTNALSLVYAGKKYLLTSLVSMCERELMLNLRVDDVCTLLDQSLAFDLAQLTTACVAFISGNTRNVVGTEDFFKMSRDALGLVVSQNQLELRDEMEVYELCVDWARQQLLSRASTPAAELVDPTDEQIRETLGDVIVAVRFPTMRQAEFARLAERSNVLTPDEKIAVLVSYVTRRRPPPFVRACIDSVSDRRRRPLPLPFRRAAREFLPTVVARFDLRVKGDGVFRFPIRLFYGIDFETSVDATLLGVGLYGGADGPSTHGVCLEVFEEREPIFSSSRATMASDGSTLPVRVDFERPIQVCAEIRYGITVCLFDGPATFCGCGGARQVKLWGNETVKFYHSANVSNSSVEEGQIATLYLKQAM